MKEVLGRRDFLRTGGSLLGSGALYLLLEKIPGGNLKEAQAQTLGEVNLEGGVWKPGMNSVIWLDKERRASGLIEVMDKIGKASDLGPRTIWMLSGGEWKYYIATAPQASTLKDIPATASLQVDLIGPTAIPEKYPQYYKQRISAAGISVKAKETVDPKALNQVKGIVLEMTSFRPDIRVKMIQEGAYMTIIPKDESIVTVPEYRNLAGGNANTGASNPVPFEGMGIRGLGAARGGQPLSGVGEEDLIYPEGHYRQYWHVTEHEIAHAIMNLAMSAEEHARVKPAYERARQAGHFSGKYAMMSADEFWAELSRAWFYNADKRLGSPEEIRAKTPEMFDLLESIYGPSRSIAGRTAG